MESLPARGVWIEIGLSALAMPSASGHSPRGECGLKYRVMQAADGLAESLPARGVWIEINPYVEYEGDQTSLPARGVWIEMPSA